MNGKQTDGKNRLTKVDLDLDILFTRSRNFQDLMKIVKTEICDCIHLCGKRPGYVSSQIIGGSEAELNQFPWIVAVERFDEDEFVAIGGGAIIFDKWILSAAHVFYE
ncbi:trypsin-1-like protein [Leptotrombidium deliense]|uniref:Trypsin-1-like protein n=1 Tax=Leptotrombidium deliense TaxID=299467 RepID=A0A443SUV1_9ACAR|nr:trypsin-1-like protein [Leptotrombidium deliense]